MKKHLTALMLLLSNVLEAQKEASQIEITPYIRKDWYPPFSYSVGPLDTPSVAINGTSWGVSVAYKVPVTSGFFLRLGGGYYRHNFNDINTTNRFGENSRRPINYPSMLGIAFFTDRYWYNCLTIKIGVEKVFPLTHNWSTTTGIDVDNYYTFSQGYHITYNNPNNPITNPYKLQTKNVFGLTCTIKAGLSKRFGKSSIGPSLILPIFDSWRQDAVFPNEDNSTSKSKWLRGIGLGITFNHSFKNNN